jgi:cytosine/adenosine deaminase-related metal-dependent hydrolase
MAGAAAEGALDHLLFAGGDAAIRDVMVAGRWVIKAAARPGRRSSAAFRSHDATACQRR